MNIKRFFALVTSLVMMVMTLAACGGKGDTDNTKNADEAVAAYKELMEKENSIMSENIELWEKVFSMADKSAAVQETGNNYGDFLLKTIESGEDKFTAEELTLLKGAAEEIRDIENKLAELERKYPDVAQKSSGDNESIPKDDGSVQKFPSFEGKDFDGNDIKSDELFSANAVTVINFWFTTCGPCVGELSELDTLEKELSEKGGTLIGINSFTLGGDKTAISEAKDVLSKKGADYRNIYFEPKGEAGKFVENVYAYPTTYVVDRNGVILGEPIVGAITEKSQMKRLNDLIDKGFAADKK